MRQISSASLPERHIRAPKQSYIDFGGDNFIFGELVYRRVLPRVGLSASWSVGELVVGDFDCRRAVWFVGELSSYHKNSHPYEWYNSVSNKYTILFDAIFLWRSAWIRQRSQLLLYICHFPTKSHKINLGRIQASSDRECPTSDHISPRSKHNLT